MSLRPVKKTFARNCIIQVESPGSCYLALLQPADLQGVSVFLPLLVGSSLCNSRTLLYLHGIGLPGAWCQHVLCNPLQEKPGGFQACLDRHIKELDLLIHCLSGEGTSRRLPAQILQVINHGLHLQQNCLQHHVTRVQVHHDWKFPVGFHLLSMVCNFCCQ